MTLKQRLTEWYDAHVVAAWYKSYALYVGMLAGTLPYLLNAMDAALASWPDVASALKLNPVTTMVLQIFLATVVLPAAKAWQQKSMRLAALKQAAKTGQISSQEGTDSIDIQVAGTPAVVVVPRVDPS